MESELRNKLIAAINRFLACDVGSDEESVELMSFVMDNVPDPEVSDYIMSADTSTTSAEDILDRAMAYKPICLPDRSKP